MPKPESKDENIKNPMDDCFDNENNPSFQLNSEFLVVDLKDHVEISIDNKSIAKLRLCVGAKLNEESGDVTLSSSAYLYVTYLDGNKTIKKIKPEKINYLSNLIISNSYAKQISFSLRTNAKPIDWNLFSVNTIYPAAEGVSDNYEKLHKKIIQTIKDIIETTKINKINLIDGGCGNGKFLEKVKAMENELGAATSCVGFDFNEENITDCNNRNLEKYYFTKGNLSSIDYILYKLRHDKIIDDSNPTFLILSGSLTTLVLPNGFQAVEILKKVALSNITYLIGGGENEPFINHYIAKRIGYKEHSTQTSEKNSMFFSYQKMSREEILQNKIKKINKSNFLDLSMCPDPEKVISELENHLKNNITIDLSYCTITNTLLKQLNELVIKYPDTKFIFWHWNKRPITLLEKNFSGVVPLATNHISNDSYLMAPKSFFCLLQPDTVASKDIIKMKSNSSSTPTQQTFNANFFDKPANTSSSVSNSNNILSPKKH